MVARLLEVEALEEKLKKKDEEDGSGIPLLLMPFMIPVLVDVI